MQYRTEFDRPIDNEGRANWAENALIHGCDAEAQSVDLNEYPQTVEQDVSDLLANLMHFCVRAGIEWSSVMDRAERAAEGDLEDGPEAARDTGTIPQPGGADMAKASKSSSWLRPKRSWPMRQ